MPCTQSKVLNTLFYFVKFICGGFIYSLLLDCLINAVSACLYVPLLGGLPVEGGCVFRSVCLSVFLSLCYVTQKFMNGF